MGRPARDRRSSLLRVLAYGRVADGASFERQLEHLAAHHAVVTAAQVLDTFEGGRALPADAVLLVFHDEHGFAASVWPSLQRHGFAAALFVAATRGGARAAPAEELRELARQGVVLGLSGPGPAEPRGSRAVLVDDLRRVRTDLEQEFLGPVRLCAYAGGRPGAEEVEAARAAGTELGFTALSGTNDLRHVDPLRLRSLQLDGGEPLETLRARLAARAEPFTPEERAFLRAARARRTRLRCVDRPLDALVTAGACPRPRLSAALRAVVLGPSHYERLRNLVSLATRPVPALERFLWRAVIDVERLPLAVSGLELAGHGSAATVFRLHGEARTAAHVLKVYRWTLGQPVTLLVQMARRHRARYRELRGWFGASVLPAHFLVLHGPLRGLRVAACLQARVGATDLLALADEELLRLLRSRPELRAEFSAFARRVLDVRAQGFLPDLLGAGNLVLIEDGTGPRLRLIDYGLFDLRLRAPGQPAEALAAVVRRFESLLRALAEVPREA